MIKGYYITDTTEWLKYKPAIDLAGGDYDNDSVPVCCLYQIDPTIQGTLHDFLTNLLQGNITPLFRAYRGPDILHKMYNNSYTSFSLVNDIFRNISDGITSNIRQTGNVTSGAFGSIPVLKNTSDFIFAGNQLAVGTVFESDICLQIRWGWLSYPAFIITLAVVFIVCTILDGSIHTARPGNGESQESIQGPHSMFRPTGVWKSSVLPLMFHGLEDQALRGANPLRLVSEAELNEVAKGMKARLMQGKDGWKLTKLD